MVDVDALRAKRQLEREKEQQRRRAAGAGLQRQMTNQPVQQQPQQPAKQQVPKQSPAQSTNSSQTVKQQKKTATPSQSVQKKSNVVKQPQSSKATQSTQQTASPQQIQPKKDTESDISEKSYLLSELKNVPVETLRELVGNLSSNQTVIKTEVVKTGSTDYSAPITKKDFKPFGDLFVLNEKRIYDYNSDCDTFDISNIPTMLADDIIEDLVQNRGLPGTTVQMGKRLYTITMDNAVLKGKKPLGLFVFLRSLPNRQKALNISRQLFLKYFPEGEIDPDKRPSGRSDKYYMDVYGCMLACYKQDQGASVPQLLDEINGELEQVYKELKRGRTQSTQTLDATLVSQYLVSFLLSEQFAMLQGRAKEASSVGLRQLAQDNEALIEQLGVQLNEQAKGYTDNIKRRLS